MYLARKNKLGKLFSTSLPGGGTEPREGLTICRAKAVPSFLSHFKTLSVGPVPGIEQVTRRSAVKRSTNGANPATFKNIHISIDIPHKESIHSSVSLLQQ